MYTSEYCPKLDMEVLSKKKAATCKITEFKIEIKSRTTMFEDSF
jgi:hypothetical protein